MYRVILPLKIQYNTKKDGTPCYFNVDLNHYRNTHYRVLNLAKIAYKEYIKDQIDKLPKFKNLLPVYHFYPGNKIRKDISNMCCIHSKFFLDAMTEYGKIDDDSTQYIPMEIYKVKEIDKENPRVEVLLYGDTVSRSDSSTNNEERVDE